MNTDPHHPDAELLAHLTEAAGVLERQRLDARSQRERYLAGECMPVLSRDGSTHHEQITMVETPLGPRLVPSTCTPDEHTDADEPDIRESDRSVRVGSSAIVSATGETIRTWRLDAFTANPVALWSHDSDRRVGRVTELDADDGGRITARIVLDTSDEGERAWQAIRAGDLRGVSLGWSRRPDEATTATLKEISLVHVPRADDGLVLRRERPKPKPITEKETPMNPNTIMRVAETRIDADDAPDPLVAVVERALAAQKKMHNNSWRTDADPPPNVTGDPVKARARQAAQLAALSGVRLDGRLLHHEIRTLLAVAKPNRMQLDALDAAIEKAKLAIQQAAAANVAGMTDREVLTLDEVTRAEGLLTKAREQLEDSGDDDGDNGEATRQDARTAPDPLERRIAEAKERQRLWAASAWRGGGQ